MKTILREVRRYRLIELTAYQLSLEREAAAVVRPPVDAYEDHGDDNNRQLRHASFAGLGVGAASVDKRVYTSI
jgi:hypothetical protein